MDLRTTGRLLLPAALTVAICTGPGAGAHASAPGPTGVTGHDVGLTPLLDGLIRRYWTPARMATASAPAPVPAPAPPARAVVGGLWARGGAVARTTGKVFYTVTGRDHVCSASTVRSANRDVVITAAHCVRPARGWATNWIFVPGYRDGNAPYGGFTARRMFVTAEWLRDPGGPVGGDHDVALVVLAPAAGRHVMDVVGGQRLAFDGPGGRRTHAFGYPTLTPYNGERLAYCSGDPARPRRGDTTGRGLRCDLSRGASGGPWLTGFDPATGEGVITSVSSFKFADDQTVLYGPPFGASVRRVYERAQRA
ncbi:trypsin-like serine peptidase [Actinomadura hibisca]|uniref:trypsin-like serine peptidase n=1 Tax=Actinomadura hibisca TaxID=68565 RepID=UPI0008344249|nr:trypsin-like peptidase domain-containing protein [Actinomadura hibisca]